MTDTLFEQYKKNVSDLIDLCRTKTVVFDFDGTLTRFFYANDRMLPCKDAEIEEYTKSGGNIYENIYILKTMQYVVSHLNKDDVFILTSTVPSLRDIKNKIIIQNFELPLEKIIHTNRSSEKLGVLDKMHHQLKKEIIFIEDNYKILLNAEEAFDFVRGYHISRLLP